MCREPNSTRQTKVTEVPDKLPPFFPSKQLTWKFHFFKWQWGCKPIFIYTFVTSSEPPALPVVQVRGPRGFGSSQYAQIKLLKGEVKPKGNFCEAWPLVGLSWLLDAAKQTTSNAEKHMLRTFLMNPCPEASHCSPTPRSLPVTLTGGGKSCRAFHLLT